MGVAFYPELDPPIEGYSPDLMVNGKAIANAMELLDQWARELGVREMMSFYSESHEESFGHIGEDVPPDMDECSIEWSDPNEGLATVRPLLQRVRSLTEEVLSTGEREHRRVVKVSSLLSDLAALEGVLVTAIEHGRRFRLRIDL